MLKTLLSATVICFACLTLGGCADDGVEGTVDDYGGEREVTEKVSMPGNETDPDKDLMSQDQGGGGGGG